ncbi:hypothetical protein H6G76_30440 [Nostoc sp. FACHB-152]|uniref:hypothetical protein n=1 Tax=Nostoc sp. FACHB-152 TaxID=2692837 RepID=UPI001686C0CF|nr:hypothetical protein [Nostoc sp. FACHB-152]MBD2451368.1 hypothetical protein [Nostoc sp. FACHB-152]
MRVVVQVVEKVYQEAHLEIPDGLTEETIRQHIVGLYNSGEMTPDLNIFQVEFESMNATIVQQPQEAA